MNERIKDLAKQATNIVEGWSDEHGTTRHYEFNQEKFAELIVRECIGVAVEQKQWVEDQKVFNPQDEFWNRARIQQSQHIIEKIQEHFGIKS